MWLEWVGEITHIWRVCPTPTLGEEGRSWWGVVWESHMEEGMSNPNTLWGGGEGCGLEMCLGKEINTTVVTCC